MRRSASTENRRRRHHRQTNLIRTNIDTALLVISVNNVLKISFFHYIFFAEPVRVVARIRGGKMNGIRFARPWIPLHMPEKGDSVEFNKMKCVLRSELLWQIVDTNYQLNCVTENEFRNANYQQPTETSAYFLSTFPS